MPMLVIYANEINSWTTRHGSYAWCAGSCVCVCVCVCVCLFVQELDEHMRQKNCCFLQLEHFLVSRQGPSHIMNALE